MKHHKEVNSSTISEVHFDDETNVLTVRFNHGGTYDYEGVSPDEHQALITAPSVGKHFMANIRPKYNWIKQAPSVEEAAVAS